MSKELQNELISTQAEAYRLQKQVTQLNGALEQIAAATKFDKGDVDALVAHVAELAKEETEVTDV